MKRSEINSLIHHAEDFFSEYKWRLPAWGYWTPQEWSKDPKATEKIRSTMLGWDLTDFGLGDFSKRGLLLFTVRNGSPDNRDDKPYAEKIMIVRDRQETPWHFHWEKVEDIINRGGGTLVLELNDADRETERLTERSFTVEIDGIPRRCNAGERVELSPGESITLPAYLYHRFWAEDGVCLVGEVSKVNDDNKDNRFLDELGRFPTIEEDEAPYRLLVSDYTGL
ncbi:MAG: D-lyxose/D-mannose family sugar isomerase [Spirochaeta sp.]|jgi:D-lyxose ketol-isomerase|nr:D-lyxose/D-mannose family sugar isomerase [Spirochaeta sp.]